MVLGSEARGCAATLLDLWVRLRALLLSARGAVVGLAKAVCFGAASGWRFPFHKQVWHPSCPVWLGGVRFLCASRLFGACTKPHRQAEASGAGDNFVASFKLLLIGDSNVGKSCLASRFVSDRFSFALKPTIGIDFRNKDVVIDGNNIKVTLWDTAGEERFYSLSKSYFRGSHGVLAVYDVTNKKSFEHVEEWMKALRESAGEDVQVALIGNKCDLVSARAVSTSEGELLARKLDVSFYETSALASDNVEEAFTSLTRKCFDKFVASGAAPKAPAGIRALEEPAPASKSSCCS